MRRVVPRDPLLVGRIGALAGAGMWLFIGGQAIVPVAALALAFLAATIGMVWWLDIKRGRAAPLQEMPMRIVVADLVTAGVWTIGTAPNPRSIAFVIIVAVGALAMYRLGRAGIVATMFTFLVARVGMEVIRIAFAQPTPAPQLLAEIIVTSLAVLILAATVDSYRAEQSRAEVALRLGRSLERVATEIAAETEPEQLLRTIARGALALVEAQHATVNIRRGEEFVVAAGAGTGERVVGVHAQSHMGIVGAVLRARSTVAVADYATDPTAVPAIRDLGVRAVVGVPIFLHGQFAATITVARLDPRPFDADDRRALEGLASHAAIALRNARIIEHGRRLEALSREVSGAMPEDVIERIAGEIKAAFDVEWVMITEIKDGAGRPLAALGLASPLRGEPWSPIGPLLREVVSRRELTVLRDYVGDRTPEDDRPITVLALGTDPLSHVVLTTESHRTTHGAFVPIKSRGKLLGVLASEARAENAFDDEDVAVLQTLANLVATAFENAEALTRMRELYLASVRALAAAVDARDPYTRSHSARVAALARSIGEEMQLGTDQLRRVQLGALLHDIGKIGVPDAILNKPAALTGEEWTVMRTHSELGASIVNAVEPLRDLAPIVRAHHERYDGSGYPDQLGGDLVPVEAYIVAAADAFEVIVSRRSYKQAQTVEHACTELLRCRSTQFHPAVVDAFLRVLERDRAQGAAQLRRIAGRLHEDIEDVPGPGLLREQFASSAPTHGRRLAILQRLASEISAVLDIDELATRLIRIVCDAMGYENGFLLTLDETGENLVIRAAVGPSGSYVGQRLGRGQGISWWVIEHGQLQNVADGELDPRFYGPPEIRSVLCVPLLLGDERIGVLGVESPRVGAFVRDDEDLLTAVSHQVAAAVRVAKLHQAAKTAAATDPLTSLPNRRSFFARLEAELARHDGHPLPVAVLDANGLKALNDGYGHAVGDDALVRIGEILEDGTREGDLVARIGGDEFAVLFASAPLLTAERIMRRLADTIAHETLSAGQRVPTIAWGIADATGEATVDALVDAADRAMYRQKQLARRRTPA